MTATGKSALHRVPIALVRITWLLVCCATVTGCAFDIVRRPYPESVEVCPPIPAPVSCRSTCSAGSKPDQQTCELTCKGNDDNNAIVEDRSFENFDAEGRPLSKGRYLVGYVEFDDQGWFHDKRQRDVIFEAIARDRETNPGQQYLIVVFAHGWKHNADPDDDNVKEFNKLLERLDVHEHAIAKHPRKVVGIYLAWRGASVKIPILDDVTFWNRKNAGERVGSRSAKQLLMEINNLRVNLNNWDKADTLASSRDKVRLAGMFERILGDNLI